MTRFDDYETLCYQCAYAYDNFCLMKNEFEGCSMFDKDGVCFLFVRKTR